MLILSTDYRPGFPKFMGLVSSSTPTAEALTKIYVKTIEEVDLDLQRYLRGGQFRSAVYSQQLARANFIAITAAPASAFDVRLVLAELLNRPGKEQESRATLRQLAEEDPKRPESFAALGYIAWRVQENDEAVKEFRKAYELGDRNPSLLWDYGRLVRGRDRAEAIRVLTDLTKQDPARVDARLELAAVQLVSKQPGDALETLKPVKNGSKEEAPRLFLLRAHAQLDIQLWADAKESAQALAKFAVSDAEKSEAERILKYLDGRGNGVAAAPSASERPALRRVLHASIAGTFTNLDCAGKAPKMIVETAEGKKVFLIDDPDKIIGPTIDMTCGAQKKVAVKIDYGPASQPGVDGLVRGISFEP
jgi:Flp pilus assembly protein TadD